MKLLFQGCLKETKMEIIEVSKEFATNETKFPLEVTCEYCGSKLLLDREDLSCGAFGAMWYTCPVCKRRCMADEVDGITLTANNIQFPDNFWYYKDGVDISPEEINKYIKDGIKFFRENPEAFTYVTGTGNSHIMVQNYSGDEDYYVVVSKDFYDAEIPYEDIDREIQKRNGAEWQNSGVNLKKKKKKKRGMKYDKN